MGKAATGTWLYKLNFRPTFLRTCEFQRDDPLIRLCPQFRVEHGARGRLLHEHVVDGVGHGLGEGLPPAAHGPIEHGALGAAGGRVGQQADRGRAGDGDHAVLAFQHVGKGPEVGS